MDKQTEIFVKQLRFANEKNKLVTVHCVYEWEKLFKIFEKSKVNNLVKDKIILHSFQGNRKIMEKFKKINVWFSLSSGCYNEKNFEMITEIPLDRLLLESDSPSMFNKSIFENEEEYSFYFNEGEGEASHKQNHPMSILNLAKKISELKKVDIKFLMDVLKQNYKKVIENIICD